jgi:hypothetical protein
VATRGSTLEQCTTTDDTVLCLRVSSEPGSEGCAVALSSCTDEETNAVSCMKDAACTCSVNGRSVKTESCACGTRGASTVSSAADLNANCGFQLR